MIIRIAARACTFHVVGIEECVFCVSFVALHKNVFALTSHASKPRIQTKRRSASSVLFLILLFACFSLLRTDPAQYGDAYVRTVDAKISLGLRLGGSGVVFNPATHKKAAMLPQKR